MDRPYDATSGTRNLTDEERETMRAEGYRPVEIWVPDLSSPIVREQWRDGARRIAEADRREGMDDVLNAINDDLLASEPDYDW